MLLAAGIVVDERFNIRHDRSKNHDFGCQGDL